MRNGLPFSKPRVRLYGEPGNAQQYLGAAYNLLYKVRQFCETSGTPVFAMQHSLPNGAMVQAAIVGNEEIVSCYPPAAAFGVERRKPKFLEDQKFAFVLRRPGARDSEWDAKTYAIHTPGRGFAFHSAPYKPTATPPALTAAFYEGQYPDGVETFPINWVNKDEDDVVSWGGRARYLDFWFWQGNYISDGITRNGELMPLLDEPVIGGGVYQGRLIAVTLSSSWLGTKNGTEPYAISAYELVEDLWVKIDDLVLSVTEEKDDATGFSYKVMPAHYLFSPNGSTAVACYPMVNDYTKDIKSVEVVLSFSVGPEGSLVMSSEEIHHDADVDLRMEYFGGAVFTVSRENILGQRGLAPGSNYEQLSNLRYKILCGIDFTSKGRRAELYMEYDADSREVFGGETTNTTYGANVVKEWVGSIPTKQFFASDSRRAHILTNVGEQDEYEREINLYTPPAHPGPLTAQQVPFGPGYQAFLLHVDLRYDHFVILEQDYDGSNGQARTTAVAYIGDKFAELPLPLGFCYGLGALRPPESASMFIANTITKVGSVYISTPSTPIGTTPQVRSARAQRAPFGLFAEYIGQPGGYIISSLDFGGGSGVPFDWGMLPLPSGSHSLDYEGFPVYPESDHSYSYLNITMAGALEPWQFYIGAATTAIFQRAYEPAGWLNIISWRPLPWDANYSSSFQQFHVPKTSWAQSIPKHICLMFPIEHNGADNRVLYDHYAVISDIGEDELYVDTDTLWDGMGYTTRRPLNYQWQPPSGVPILVGVALTKKTKVEIGSEPVPNTELR